MPVFKTSREVTNHYYKILRDHTGLKTSDIKKLAEEKYEKHKGLIAGDGVLFLLCKDFDIDENRYPHLLTISMKKQRIKDQLLDF